MPTRTGVKHSHATAQQIHRITPNRSFVSQTQVTATPVTSAPQLQASQSSIIAYNQEEKLLWVLFLPPFCKLGKYLHQSRE